MQLDREDRISPATSSESGVLRIGAFILIVAVGAAFVATPTLRDDARREVYRAAGLVGIAPTDSEFSDVYKRLGIAPLPAGLAASSKISSNLAKLAQEPCNTKAVYALGAALVADGQERIAANAHLGFAAACRNSEGDEYRAAQILLQLGDNEKVITITSGLILKNPVVANYRYLRGKAMAGAKRYADALADYMSTIELQNDPRKVNDRVFIEMANIYLAAGKPCEAATTILAWVALAPQTRNTRQARKMFEEYAAQGCRKEEAPTDLKKL
jgi:tetratricopeptide (TPR) repeat protein